MQISTRIGVASAMGGEPFQLTGADATQTYSFTGANSGQTCAGRVYLPAGYDPTAATRYPIILCLHGKGSSSSNSNTAFIPAYKDAITASQIRKAIVVMPDGGTESWYTDSFDGADKAETKIIDDVLPYFLLHTRANGTIVGTGFSMGCWGILALAMRNLGTFSAVWGCAGPNLDADSNNAWATTDAAGFAAVWNSNTTSLRIASPISSVGGTGLTQANTAAIIAGLPIYLEKSAGDSASLASLNNFSTRITALGIPHTFIDLTTPTHAMGDYYTAAQALSTSDAGNGFKWLEAAFAGSDIRTPILLSAVVPEAGTTMVLTYSETLDSGSVPAPGDFTLGGTQATVASVGVSGAAVTLTFTTNLLVTDFETVTVTYVPGSNKIQDAFGNDAAALTAQAVTNNSTFLNGAVAWFDLSHPSGAATTSTSSVSQGSDISNAAWTKNDVTATSATTATVNGTPTDAYVSQNVTNAAADTVRNVPMVFTFKAKFVDIRYYVLETQAATAASRVFFDVQNGAVGTTGANMGTTSISAADGSGYRTCTATMNVNSGTVIMRIHASTADATITVPAAATTMDLKEMAATQVRCSSVPNLVTAGADAWANATGNQQPGYEATGGPNSKPRILGSQVAATPSTTPRRLFNSSSAIYGALDGDDAPCTLFLVVSGHGDATGCWFGVGNSGVAVADSWLFGSNNGGNGRNSSLKNDGANVGSVATADYQTTNPTIFEWFHTGTANSCRENGAAANPNAAAQDSGSIAPNRSALLGRGSSTEVQAQGGLSAGILFPSNLASGTRDQIRAYLGAIFDITVS